MGEVGGRGGRVAFGSLDGIVIGGLPVAEEQVHAGAEAIGDLLVDVLLGGTGVTLEAGDGGVQVFHHEVVDLADGRTGIVREVDVVVTLVDRNAGEVAALLAFGLHHGVRSELVLRSDKHVGIGAEALGLGDHGLGVVGQLGIFLIVTGKEGVDGRDHQVRRPVTDGRVTVGGRTGRILAADGEPVVVVVVGHQVGGLCIVAEQDHQELPVIRRVVELGRITQVREHTVEGSLCTLRHGRVDFLQLRFQDSAALGSDLVDIGAGGENKAGSEGENYLVQFHNLIPFRIRR